MSAKGLINSVMLSLLLWAIIFFLIAKARAEDHPPSPHLKTRPATIVLPDDPFVGNANFVHNSAPSLHRNWIARHPRIFGALVIGAGAGIGAGISLSQRRGICQGTYEGQPYYGTAPCPREK